MYRDTTPKWSWVEAFCKFGFDDGDGTVETNKVAKYLKSEGFKIKIFKWRPHNTIIVSIQKDGCEFMPDKSSGFLIGYHDPRAYLSARLTEMLDKTFPPSMNFVFPLSNFNKIGD